MPVLCSRPSRAARSSAPALGLFLLLAARGVAAQPSALSALDEVDPPAAVEQPAPVDEEPAAAGDEPLHDAAHL